jgi:NAD(P)-dependent dehydrogenase (short-subunit alcohol dehydrogenase family)
MTTTVAKPLADRTLIMSGGSPGIGLEIAKRVAADGANITLIAKTYTAHPKLPGTIHTAAAELEEAGGTVLKFVGGVRMDNPVELAVEQTIDRFGGIDIVVNNASAIDVSSTDAISMKKYDLMQDIDCRGSFLLAKLCLPSLRESAQAGRNPHILTLSPPLNLNPRSAGSMLAYTIAKYGMSLTTLGLGEELKSDASGSTRCGRTPPSRVPRCGMSSAATMWLPTREHLTSWPTRHMWCSPRPPRRPAATSSSMTRSSGRTASQILISTVSYPATRSSNAIYSSTADRRVPMLGGTRASEISECSYRLLPGYRITKEDNR